MFNKQDGEFINTIVQNIDDSEGGDRATLIMIALNLLWKRKQDEQEQALKEYRQREEDLGIERVKLIDSEIVKARAESRILTAEYLLKLCYDYSKHCIFCIQCMNYSHISNDYYPSCIAKHS